MGFWWFQGFSFRLRALGIRGLEGWGLRGVAGILGLGVRVRGQGFLGFRGSWFRGFRGSRGSWALSPGRAREATKHTKNPEP